MKRPSLHVPLKSAPEVGPLLEAGADSFYGGLVLPHPEGSTAAQDPAGCLVSRRAHPSNNFPDVDSFLEAQQEIAAAGRSLFLPLNEHSNPPEVMRRIEALLDRLCSVPGLTGVIVADLGLAHFLAERYPDLTLVASTGLALANSGAVAVAQKLGIERVVLPRMLRVAEMSALVARCPEVEFEAFVLNDRCPNMDGLCNFVHWEVGDTHFPNQCRFVRLDGTSSPTRDSTPAVDQQANFKLSMRFREDACGACSLRSLKEGGIQHLKIVGRDRSLESKLQAVTFISGLLDQLDADEVPAGDFTEMAKQHYLDTYGHACSPDQCYLPGEEDPSTGRDP